jgi:hypothetical protein
VLKASEKTTSHLMLCGKISAATVAGYDWLSENSGGANTLSWWDYGQWVNYIGQSRTEIRGDLYYPELVLRAADAFASNDTPRLSAFMGETGSRFLVLNSESMLRWNSIVYDACLARSSVEGAYDEREKSQCERNLQFEYVNVPLNSANPQRCSWDDTFIAVRSNFNRTYCFSDPAIALPGEVPVLFTEFGARLGMRLQDIGMATSAGGVQNRVLLVLYDNATWPLRQGEAYDSNYYRGMYLGSLPGFRKVYPESGSSNAVVVLEKIS